MLSTALRIARNQGTGDLLRYVGHRAIEEYYERRFGVRTGGEIDLNIFGIHDPDAVRYSATPYPAFFKAMRLLPDVTGQTFVDYGSGQGRVVICAATYPFKSVIGIELAQELSRQARLNCEAARPRFRCSDVQLLTMNATNWEIPDDVTVFHFYNPFLSQTLENVIGGIASSLRNHPRTAWLMFACPWWLRPLIAQGAIPHDWIKSARDARWPFTRDITDKYPDADLYRIYKLDSTVLHSISMRR
jgi:hypothetical protein